MTKSPLQRSLIDEGLLTVPVEPAPREAHRERLQALVEVRRRVCVDCGEDVAERVFQHRASLRPTWDRPVCRLVRAETSLASVRLEMAKCDVLCRRCQCRRLVPKMLGARFPSMSGLVAKERSTTSRGAKRVSMVDNEGARKRA